MKKIPLIVFSVIIFVSIVSLIAILIANGYNFSGKGIQENGILDIDSIPQGAEIYINGEKKAETPTKLDLKIGTYEVELIYPDYRSWKKEIHIDSTLITKANAILFPEELGLEQITFTDIDKVFFSENKEYAFYTILKGDNAGIWSIKIEKNLFDISDVKPTKINDLSVFPNTCFEQNYQFDINSSNKNAIVKCSGQTNQFFLYSIENNDTKPLDINSIFGFSPLNVTFGINENELIITDSEFVLLFDTRTNRKEFITKFDEKTKSQFLISQNKYYIFEFDLEEISHLYEFTSDFQKKEIYKQTFTNLPTDSTLFASKNSEILIFTNSTGSYYFYPEKSELVQFSTQNVKIEKWLTDEISMLFLSENNLFSLIIHPVNITEFEIFKLIDNYNQENYSMKWTSNSLKLIYYDDSAKKLSTMDRDGTNIVLIYEGELAEKFGFDMSGNCNYFILNLVDDEKKTNLYSIQLLV